MLPKLGAHFPHQDGIHCRKVYQALALRYLDTVVKLTIMRGLSAIDPMAVTQAIVRHTQNNMARRALGLYKGEPRTWAQ